jgi:L-fuconolactonase
MSPAETSAPQKPVMARPTRVIDAHVHLWDPSRTEWYPYLSGASAQFAAGDRSRMARRFDAGIYRAEAEGWNVEKFVNVAAATGRHSVEETIELDRRAQQSGDPAAIIGGLPPAATVAEAIGFIDEQMAASRFRGVRPMGGLERPVPEPEVLGALRDRGLVFELMAHPDRLRAAAGALGGFEELVVVVEHTGWPRSDTEDERALWQAGMDALADIGPNVVCKLSGLAMPFGTLEAAAWAPWIEGAIEAFGVDRCMFASNFPVDSVAGTFDELYSTFSTLAASFTSQERAKLFADNAERVYRL